MHSTLDQACAAHARDECQLPKGHTAWSMRQGPQTSAAATAEAWWQHILSHVEYNISKLPNPKPTAQQSLLRNQ